jgi:magnesium-transporting ATPase (P-type)
MAIENADNETTVPGKNIADEPTIIESANFAAPGQPMPFCQSANTMSLLSEAISCNTSGDHTDTNATEKAMLKFIRRCNVDYMNERMLKMPGELMRFVFDPVRKRMSTIVEV